jgi:hypothetical protein
MSTRWASTSVPSTGSESWPSLRRAQPSGDGDVTGGWGGNVVVLGHEPAVDEQQPTVGEPHRDDDVVAGLTALRTVDDVHGLVGEVLAGGGHRAPLDIVGVDAGRQHRVERGGRLVVALLDLGVELLALVEPPQLPQPEVDHRHDPDDHQQVEPDPLRPQQEPIHRRVTVSPGAVPAPFSGQRVCRV